MTAIGLDVANLSLVQAAEAVRQGEVSAVALLEACLANLDAHEEAVNATIWVDREGAFGSKWKGTVTSTEFPARSVAMTWTA